MTSDIQNLIIQYLTENGASTPIEIFESMKDEVRYNDLSCELWALMANDLVEIIDKNKIRLNQPASPEGRWGDNEEEYTDTLTGITIDSVIFNYDDEKFLFVYNNTPKLYNFTSIRNVLKIESGDILEQFEHWFDYKMEKEGEFLLTSLGPIVYLGIENN